MKRQSRRWGCNSALSNVVVIDYKITTVIKGGKVYDSAAIEKALGIAPGHALKWAQDYSSPAMRSVHFARTARALSLPPRREISCVCCAARQATQSWCVVQPLESVAAKRQKRNEN